jgi:hypothetical protein
MTTVEHGEAGDLPQEWTGEQWWQDSAFAVWWAEDAGIGGVVRLGHEPGFEGGISALWFGLTTRDGQRFRRNTTNALGAADRLSNGWGALDGRYAIYFEDGHVRYRVRDTDCTLDLAVQDFYPRTDFFPPTAGTLVDDFASSHFESSGRITGEVVLGDTTYEVDGLCHRDRSWGLRKWDTLLSHRWVPGTFGPHLSFGSICWHGIDGSLRRFGYIVRDGVVERAEEIEVVVHMEPDGISYRGGSATWHFADGDTFSIEPKPLDGFVFEHHGIGDVDTICPLELDGQLGFCDLEVSNNPRAGRGPITEALFAARGDGLSRRAVALPR